MAFTAGLRFWGPRGARARVPVPSRPRRPGQRPTRLEAELLEDRAVPSAGAGTNLLPRLPGGPLQGALRQGETPQAVHIQDTSNSGGQDLGGSGQGGQQASVSNSGPGYPAQDPIGPAFANQLLSAVRSGSALNPVAPSGQVVQGFPMSPMPMLTAGTQAVSATPSALTAAADFRGPGATDPGASAVRAASGEADAVRATPAPANFANALALARTDDSARGVRTDSPPDLGRLFRPGGEAVELTADRGEAGRVAFGPGVPPGAGEERAFTGSFLPEAADRDFAPAAPGRDQADDIAGLLPLEHLCVFGALPGTPNLATSLSPLAPEGHEPAPGSAGSSALRNVTLGALFAVGSLGLGQFRDSPSPRGNPESVSGLRSREEDQG